jgi:hypothetical protein
VLQIQFGLLAIRNSSLRSGRPDPVSTRSRACPERALPMRSLRKMRSVRNQNPCLFGLCVFALSLAASTEDANAQADRRDVVIRERRDRLVEAFRSDVQGKVDELSNRGVADGLAELKVWLEPVDHQFLIRQPLSRKMQAAIPDELSVLQREWRVWLKKRREDLATELYALSRQAVQRRLPGSAWQLIHEVVWFDPDHTNARHLLGYQQFEDEWVTPFEAQMRRSNPPREWHRQFGWLPSTHVERYEAGQRMFNSHWLPADVEAERRRDFRFAWEIETDHFVVKTNVSQERGVELAVLLEGFHDWFQRTFPEFFTTPQQLNEMLQRGAGRRGPVRRKPFVVHFYRTQKDYVDRLKAKNPRIEITNGIYMPDERISHFFYDPDADTESSLYHEATHQILFELQAVPHEIGIDANFWVVEGLACYMESFRQQDGQVTIGTPSNIRFYWAQRRLVDENFYAPLGQLSQLGRVRFQNSTSLRQLYSQSSGLTHFFLHYHDGLYRDALIEHVLGIYGPPPRRGTIPGLDRLTGVSFPELDQQYRSYISELDTEEKAVSPGGLSGQTLPEQ